MLVGVSLDMPLRIKPVAFTQSLALSNQRPLADLETLLTIETFERSQYWILRTFVSLCAWRALAVLGLREFF